ncbi:importin-11 isoform X2 [Strongylocentrotus purpuratus]|uniref:Importin-11 n=1 Tax=Strongylocentrotus purpuratus TaxID=7668 RepID=A0A7M7RED5_STRPU|nr:importin-11 isoform X2 [Strongylocentrotus purpuratus]|eukprot:XP_011672007.1 PREDICTED: importin-11 [Strongylocentrotus purpuratus]
MNEEGCNAVLEVLTRATSQDPSILKPAEQQLKQWEAQPGFYSILQTIIQNHSIGVNVRWLAVLFFKNGIDRYWRKNATNAISDTEKVGIRAKLVARFDEPIAPIATQLAVLISKIARMDCPRIWPELVPILLEAVKQPDLLAQQRALLTLHHVTKTLASKRLATDRKLFQELTSNIFGFVLTLWNTYTEKFLQAANAQDHTAMATSLELSALALKVLRKQLVFGITEPGKSQEAMMLIQMIFQRVRPYLEVRASLPANHTLREKLEKMAILHTKVLLDCQENFPLAYIDFIGSSLELCTSCVFSDDNRHLMFERFTVQCMNLIKGIVKCEKYKERTGPDEEPDPVTVKAEGAKKAFFTESIVTEICQRLIMQYFPLGQEDLHLWETDPEGFVSDEGGESWKFSLRPCTETLFLTLFHANKSVFIPVLIQMVQKVQDASDTEDIQVLLQKEAVYNALGQAAFELFDDVDFDQWFTSHLLKELQNMHPRYKMIRRRVIWLVGQWIGVKLSPSLHPTFYQAILPLLSADEDLVVRISAAQALKIAVDDFEFKTEAFLPFLESSFSLLFQLLQQVSECDTKMSILHVMSFIIERVGPQIRPFSTSLAQYLPLLWEDSAEHNMLRCVILSTLIHLVQGLGPHSTTLYPFLLPIIKFSTDVSQPPHVYLMEDGVDLWYETIQNAPAMTPELLQLFSNMPEVLEMATENLKTCLLIISSYVILGKEQFMQSHGQTVATCTTGIVAELRTEGVTVVLKTIETVFKMFPIEGPHFFESYLPKVLEEILSKDIYPMLMTMYVSLLCRIIIKNQDYFFSVLDGIAKSWKTTPDELLTTLIQTWVDRMDQLAAAERRKLTGLAFASLMTSSSRAVMERLPDMMYIIVEVLHDVCREENDKKLDYLVMSEDRSDEIDDEYETLHDKRMRELSRQDPIHNTSFPEYVKFQMGKCERLHGPAVFQQIMDSIDEEVLQQLKGFIS